jgi:hypothetical protein
MRWRTPILASLLGVLSVGLSATTALAAAPVPVTGAATDVTPVGATLNGSVDPRGAATSAYFQYGTTTKYGKRTPAQDAGINPGAVPIAATISGLASNQTYHVRVVAANKDGQKVGGDRTFKTSNPTTTPVQFPNPVPYGDPVEIAGQIVGSGAAGADVSIFSHPFPYTDPLTQLGSTVVSDSQGNYLFIFAHALIDSQYEVRGKTSPPFTSAPQLLLVSSKISFRVPSSIKKGRKVHFSGIVAPAQDGIVVQIRKRRPNGSYGLFATTALQHRADGTSGYSVSKRLNHTSTFLATVRSAGGAWQPGTSPKVHTVRVRRH